MGAIRKACEKKVEFGKRSPKKKKNSYSFLLLNYVFVVFADAPIVLHPADIPNDSKEWLEAAASNNNNSTTETDLALIPRGWWRANVDRTVMEGLERSLEYLKEILKNDTFDVSIKKMRYFFLPLLMAFFSSVHREYLGSVKALLWQAF